MKRYYMISMLLIVLASACSKKDDVGKQPAAALNVINAAIGTVNVKVNPGANSTFSYAKSNNQVAYGANLLCQVVPGNRNITVVSTADTTKTYFSRTINFTQSINTLYLSGQAPTIDTMFREEKDVPFIQSYALNPDSSFYVRLVNLSSNSTPLNVKMTVSKLNVGASTSTEVSSLAYKSITGFKKYSADFRVTSSYVFEAWNTANTIRLASITLPLANIRFRTVSIIIQGVMVDPLPTPPAPPVPNQLSLFQVIYF